MIAIQTDNNCAETHLSGGVLSTFVFMLIAIAHSPLWCHVRGDVHASNNNDAAKHYSVCEQAHG